MQNLHEFREVISYCRATIEAAVRGVLGAAAVDASHPLMEAGLDSLGMLSCHSKASCK